MVLKFCVRLPKADLALEDSGVGGTPWDGWQGCLTWPLCTSSGTLSVVSSSEETVLVHCPLEPSAARGQGSFDLSQGCWLCDTGPWGPLTAGMLLSHLVESCRPPSALGSRAGTLLPPRHLDLVGFSIPPKVTQHPCHPTYCWHPSTWGFSLE